MRKKKVLARVVMCTLSMLLSLSSLGSLASAQVSTTGRIIGIVMDQQGAVIHKADVTVKNAETGEEYKSKSGDEGTFVIASLPVATYTVTVTASGFKTTVIQNVKVELGKAASVEAKLEVGAATESVTITSGAEVLQKDSTNIGSIISGRQITELPFTSRDALDLVLTLPGTTTPGRPRTSSINGLPKGSLFITLDGVNAQDNFLRTSDAFFTYIRPRIDAIEEVEVSTSTPGAEASAGGAIHIRFVTKGGSNEYHGGAYWYNRQRAYNANYYFNNLTGTPRAQVMLNQWGVKAGGPITPWLKDRAWFFVNYEEFRLPEQTVRIKNILSPDAQAGIFKYTGGPAAGINLLALAASKGFPGTFDPTISKILADIRTASSKGAVKGTSDANFQQLTFTNTGGQVRRFPTIRFDFNVTSKHHVEAIYNFQDFASKVDFLNGRDPAFPEPIPQILGSQASNRFSLATALRSQLSSVVVNEARFGLTGGTVVFFPELGPASFAPFGGVAPTFPSFSTLALSSPFSGTTNSRRNSPVQQFTDNLSWTKGTHNYNFGAAYNRATSFSQTSGGSLVPDARFDTLSTDPATTPVFASANFPGADAAKISDARRLYALLTGRISEVRFNAKLDETTKKYSLDGTGVERNSVHGYGFYFQDYYKFRPNLSINYGLRWEAALSPQHNNGVYIRPTGLYGISGEGNLFKPGVTPGVATTYVAVDKNTKAFEDDRNNWAPSLGFAWSPHFGNSWLKRMFGEGDKTVIRGAYAVSYVVGGFADYNGIWTSNPGLVKNINLLAGSGFPAGSILLRNGIPAFTTPAPPTFPVAAAPGVEADDFNPNLKSPYVQSWNIGIQRELTKDTVFEARYLGNHSIGLGRQYNLNEVNIFESGFLPEFISAQKNLAINGGTSFQNKGLPGQAALPIFEKSFGTAVANFTNSTFIQLLNQGQAGSLANQLSNVTTAVTFQNNRVAAGLPANLFIANPSVLGGGAFLATNPGSSTYSSLQLELRRRLSHGLFVNGSYVWSHALTNQFTSSGTSQPHTLRNIGLDKGPSPWDIRHSFKVSYTYDLPIGAGHKFDYKGPGNVVGKVLEGWSTDGIVRWTSGRVFPLTSGRGTFNQFDAGVELVGMSIQELQSLVKIRKDPAASTRGSVFWLPQDIIDNTVKAFFCTSADCQPTGRYLAPPTTPGKLGTYFFLYGPNFFRADLSIVKKTRITERANVEFRAEFLNAFNNINFLIGNVGAADVANSDFNTVSVGTQTFGQTSHAYRDISTTNDPGGRLMQFVLRVNF